MTDHDTTAVEESGYGAAEDGDLGDAPDQAQQERHPVGPEEAAQDDYANTDEHADD